MRRGSTGIAMANARTAIQAVLNALRLEEVNAQAARAMMSWMDGLAKRHVLGRNLPTRQRRLVNHAAFLASFAKGQLQLALVASATSSWMVLCAKQLAPLESTSHNVAEGAVCAMKQKIASPAKMEMEHALVAKMICFYRTPPAYPRALKNRIRTRRKIVKAVKLPAPLVKVLQPAALCVKAPRYFSTLIVKRAALLRTSVRRTGSVSLVPMNAKPVAEYPQTVPPARLHSCYQLVHVRKPRPGHRQIGNKRRTPQRMTSVKIPARSGTAQQEVHARTPSSKAFVSRGK